MRLLLLLSLCMLSNLLLAQTDLKTFEATDSIALQIPDSMTSNTRSIARYISAHFSNDNDKVRAAFIWVATTFSYDTRSLKAVKEKDTETPQDKIDKVLRTHKGVCVHYALTFANICNQMSIPAHMITGYTRHNNIMSNLAHGWVCVLLDGQWHLYDPTWASGFLTEGSFTKKLNNIYYDQSPSLFAKEHMPFDPIWQMLAYPLTRAEFANGKEDSSVRKIAIDFADSIAAYERMNEEQQLVASARRIRSFGVPNELTAEKLTEINDQLKYIKQLADYNVNNDNLTIYNDAVADYNQGVKLFNKFIEFRNRQFRPSKSDEEIQAMVNETSKYLENAQQKIGNVKPTISISNKQLAVFSKNITELLSRLNEQKRFVATYLAKDKDERKEMLAN